jgi:predicted Rossmann fold flavoprotein
MPTYDVIIIGAGAAGLMCAIEAGKRGRRVLVLDHAKAPGEKIRISGGGRCNFTNRSVTPDNFLSNNPRFCISALRRYTQHDFIALVEKHGITYHERAWGQLFCDHSAQQITNMLLTECRDAGVKIRLKTRVEHMTQREAGFQLDIGQAVLSCAAVVIATGGPAIPQIGATGWGYEVAKQFGMAVVQPEAALVPLKFRPDMLHRFQTLSGNALNVVASCNGQQFEEALLFTHRGVSGPAILQISSYWQTGDEVAVNLVPDQDVLRILKEKKQRQPKQELRTALATIVPKRLAHCLCEGAEYDGRLAEAADKKLRHIAQRIHNWCFIPSGTEGFRKAEVTRGGVDTDGLSSRTFESKTVPGLYFIGEVVDVTGHLGGFNFQWAWSSGYAAGQSV